MDNSHYIQDKILYNDTIVSDLFIRYKVINKYKNNVKYYRTYTVKEGETPEYISQLFYDTTDFWWVVILMNDIIDPFYDWKLTTNQIEKYAEKIRLVDLGTLEEWLATSGHTEEQYIQYYYDLISKYSTESDNKTEINILNPRYIDNVIKDLQSYK